MAIIPKSAEALSFIAQAAETSDSADDHNRTIRFWGYDDVR
jgi:hypothetical protein